jgi:hypothetical protein
MVQEIAADPNALERFASANKQTMSSILDAAKKHGLTAHRFFGSEDGSKVLVVDEWPDAQSFEAFAQEQAPQIEPMLAAAAATNWSEPTYWRELATDDAVGWGA